MTTPWFRICIDVSHDGDIVGSSWESHVEDRIEKLCVMPAPGPFDSIDGLVADMLDDIHVRYGMQLRLL